MRKKWNFTVAVCLVGAVYFGYRACNFFFIEEQKVMAIVYAAITGVWLWVAHRERRRERLESSEEEKPGQAPSAEDSDGTPH